MATPESLASYEFQRSKDQIVCATNLLLQGQVQPASDLLQKATRPQHFATALRRRSKRFLSLLSGVGLLASARLGVGPQAARVLHQAEQLRVQHQFSKPGQVRRDQPLADKR